VWSRNWFREENEDGVTVLGGRTTTCRAFFVKLAV
jgi:hypothetical protein